MWFLYKLVQTRKFVVVTEKRMIKGNIKFCNISCRNGLFNLGILHIFVFDRDSCLIFYDFLEFNLI